MRATSSVVLGPTPLVVDAGLLEGWTLRRSAEAAGRLDAATPTREADARAVQGTLF